MQVIEIKDTMTPTGSPLAVVEADGLQKTVHLDLVDRMPEVGDYLIIHAGFALHCLDADSAEKNLRLIREMAARLDGMEDLR
jgi:hydrogenase expression/formation protein HypC